MLRSTNVLGWKIQLVSLLCLVGFVRAVVDEQTKNTILVMHNNLRNQISQGVFPGQPRPDFRPPLVWDNTLAMLAEVAAQTCVFKAGVPNTGVASQNIVASTDVQSGIQTWINQHLLYNFVTNTCRGDCSNFLNMIERGVNQIGCGMNYCQQWQKYFIVCNYGPGGPIVAKRP